MPQELASSTENIASTAVATDPSRHASRNWWAFFFDYVFFGLALTVLNPTTTMPAFAARLTDSKILIGLVGTIWFGGWLLPQLFAANYLNTQARKLPYLIGAAWIGRPFFWLFALFLFLGGITYPLLTLILFLTGFLLFTLSDGIAGVAYFDMLGKVMSAGERSRVIGAGQALRGLITIGLGWWIQRVLSSEGPAYPINYAIIFGLAGTLLMISLVASYFIIEPIGEVKAAMIAWRNFLPEMRTILRNDHTFVRIIGVRLLAGLHMLASSFYVIYATQEVGLPESSVGLFFTTQTIGAALGGLVLGSIAARLGTRRVIQISTTVDLLNIGLVLTLVWSGSPTTLTWLFPIIFGLLGVVESTLFLGYFNYILDIAPEAERATYVGLTNTLAGVLAIAPIIGGWILERTSYSVLFTLTALVLLPAAILAYTLPQSEAKR